MFRKTQSQPVTGSAPTTTTPTTSNNTAVTASGGQPGRQPVGFETVLGANTTLKGELKSKANVRIDGNFEGSLDIDGNVLVGETARIVADIHSKSEVKIAGAVRGNVQARKVHLSRTGRVWGDIVAAALTTEEGAYIEGKITMSGHPAGAQGFGALPAPEVSVLQPMAEDVASGEPVEAELMDDDTPREDKTEH